MKKDSRIYIAGHRGLVGSAIHRELERLGYTGILTRTREQLDLLDTAAVNIFFAEEKPEYVFLAAAKVGGILANNTYPADFIHDNLVIQNNIIDASYRAGVNRLLFLGSSCIYPKLAPQPMPESSLLTGPLEPTHRPYALAKIAGERCDAVNVWLEHPRIDKFFEAARVARAQSARAGTPLVLNAWTARSAASLDPAGEAHRRISDLGGDGLILVTGSSR